ARVAQHIAGLFPDAVVHHSDHVAHGLEKASRRGEERREAVTHSNRQWRLGGLRRVPRPFFICALTVAAHAAAVAQDPMRPWLDWRTIETQHYRFTFQRNLEPWARDVAEHVESVDSALR